VARAEEIPGIASHLSFREAAARAVETRTEELFVHSEGVLDSEDIERVHAMRVATRRLRAVLEIFAPCFPEKEHRRVLKAVKRLADALGERRDPDVAIGSLTSVAEALPKEERLGVDSLVSELRTVQHAGNERLALELARADNETLQGRLLELAAAAHLPDEALLSCSGEAVAL
jgi:CHAD domain-containing protein